MITFVRKSILMKKLLEEFNNQLRDAIKIANEFKPKKHIHPQNVVIAGMGGSGIAGTFISEYANYRKAEVPVITSKTYSLPYFVNENSLVVISSYSGNTLETISALETAIHKKATIVAITSGGKIAEICKEYNIATILIPGGFPPRAALGYSIVSMFAILSKYNIFFYEWEAETFESITFIDLYQKEIQEQAKRIAETLYQTYPIIYSLGGEAVSLRLRQQLNENSKILCSHNVLPEMNHNEIVGWKCLNARHSVITLRSDYDLLSNHYRFEFCKKIFAQYDVPVIEVKAKGHNYIPQHLYLMHVADWISYELALLNKVDPMEVDVIEQLKKEIKF